jgi:hypothetical protein
MPEALTTFSLSSVQKFYPHDKSFLQPAGNGQLTPVEYGQVHRFLQQGFR